MKLKRYFLGLAAILTVVGMSSCKGDYDDWADPQSNAEEDAITIPGFTASSTSTEANPVNLNNAQPTKDSVTLASLQVPADYKYGVTNIRVVLKPTGEGAKSTVSKTFDLSSTCNMDSATIQQYVSDSYGLKPVARQFSATVLASAKTGSDYVYVNAGTFNVYIAPKAPVLSETGYYLVGNVQGWNPSDTQYKYEFGGASPYDNPEFTIRVPAASLKGGDLQFKLLDLAHVGSYDEQCVLVGDGHDAAITTDTSKPTYVKLTDNNGKDAAGKDIAGTGNIQFAGTTKQYYIIHVNLLDQTVYATAEDIPELFMTGSAYNWGGTKADWHSLTMVNGHMNLFWTIKYIEDGEQFKFSPKRAWKGGDFSPTCNGGDQASHFSTPDNVKCDKSGWYLLVVDRDAHTFKAYTPEVYLIGDAIGSWDERVASHKFSTPSTKDGEFVSPALLNDKGVRIYVDMPEIVGTGNWWKAEFGVAANGTIQYRGNSGTDGSSYTSGAGKKIYLNFTTDKGSIK